MHSHLRRCYATLGATGAKKLLLLTQGRRWLFFGGTAKVS